jgi:hypothetical protein
MSAMNKTFRPMLENTNAELVEARVDVVLEVDDRSFDHAFGTERDTRFDLTVERADGVTMEEAEAWVEANYSRLVKEFLEN